MNCKPASGEMQQELNYQENIFLSLLITFLF